MNETEKMIFRKLAQSLENITIIQKDLVINKTTDTEVINKTIEDLITAKTLILAKALIKAKNAITAKTLFTAKEESRDV